MSTVAIIGTFDTKGEEFSYIKDRFEDLGIGVFTVHCGVFEPTFTPDVSNAEIMAAAGMDINEVVAKKDRALGTDTMAKGIAALLPALYAEGKFDGVFSMGGSGGTSIASSGMRTLPIGVPKLIVSTMASGDVSPYVGAADIVMFPSIVDVQGINSFSSTIFNNAVNAMAGMLQNPKPEATSAKPLVAATMFGVTTPAVQCAQAYLEEKGYEVLVFHAVGTGGQCMEALVNGGFIKGVLDMTTTEWCDELVGGVLSAGPQRCEAAAKKGVPTVLSVGALDMVNFGPMATVPEQFAERNLYPHNPDVTLMRTTVEENKQLGEIIASKVNMSTGPCAVFLPLKGVSMIDAEGQPFWGPEEDATLFEAIRTGINPKVVELLEMDNHINDEEFAKAAAQKIIDLMEA